MLFSCSYISSLFVFFFFFFIDPAPTEIYTFPYTTLFRSRSASGVCQADCIAVGIACNTEGSQAHAGGPNCQRSEEHTSELQSLRHLVCRLLLEKKKKKKKTCT